MIQSLSLTNPSLQLAILYTLLKMIKDTPNLVEEHLETFIPLFLKLAIENPKMVFYL